MTESTPTVETRRPNLPDGWFDRLAGEFERPEMHALKAFLVEEKQKFRIFPPGKEIFNAFWMTPFDAVRVVILGQDPYHGAGQAHGLCFSVKKGVRPPPSVVNVFKEIESELGIPRPAHGDLTQWANQGILLLNTVLTVREKQAGSHQGKGWEGFTDKVISELNSKKEGLIFVLWGSKAQKKAAMIDETRHLILQSPHPSPFSVHRGFFGNGHFKAINAHLTAQGGEAIQWGLTP